MSRRFLVLLYGFLVSAVAAVFYLFTKGFVAVFFVALYSDLRRQGTDEG